MTGGSPDGQDWSATQRWASHQFKPSFNGLVVQDGFIDELRAVAGL